MIVLYYDFSLNLNCLSIHFTYLISFKVIIEVAIISLAILAIAFTFGSSQGKPILWLSGLVARPSLSCF